jgi:hypothetical protein
LSQIDEDIASQDFEKIYSIIPKLSKIISSIDSGYLPCFLVFLALIIFYNRMEKFDRPNKIARAILSVIASILFTTGRIFYNTIDFELITDGLAQISKVVLVFWGYTIFGGYLLLALEVIYSRLVSTALGSGDNVEQHFQVVLIAVVFMIAWLPYLYLYYPAIFMGDTEDMLYMAFNYKTGLVDMVNLINENVYITNHHPVVYTLIIGFCIRLARFVGMSDNFGIFMLTLFQYIITAFVISYALTYFAKKTKRKLFVKVAICFYVLCPWIPKYVIMISKDTFFADFILLLMIEIHKSLNDEMTVKNQVKIVLISVGAVLLRKNGLYIVIISLMAIILVYYRKQWKKWLICLMIVIAFSSIYSNVILPIAQITDGSISEALSIPFQQTARYVAVHGDEVTEDEKNAIDKILQYDTLKEVYSGTISDPVKGTYRKEATPKELMDYFAVWFKMFLKHPGTYVAATLNNCYGYFYPVVNDELKLYRTSKGSMANANRDGYFNFENIYDDIHIWLRDIITLYDMIWMKLPGINIFMTSAFYVWIAIIGFYLKLINNDKKGMAGITVMIGVILTAIAGPCNAVDYERYIFPCILASPIMIAIILYEGKLEVLV